MTPTEALVARLEAERLGGMPRWQVRPLERHHAPQADPLPVGVERLRLLAAEVQAHERRRGAA